MKKFLILTVVALMTASTVGCGFDWLTGKRGCGGPPPCSPPACGEYYGSGYAAPGPDIYSG